MPSDNPARPVAASPATEQQKLRRRNLAVLGALVAWCVIIFAVAIVKMGGAGSMH